MKVLVGDTRTGWNNPRPADLETVRKILDVGAEFKRWYLTNRNPNGPAIAHMKTWMLLDNGQPVAALNGSANLTRQGLYRNYEIMTEVTAEELAAVHQTVRRAWSNAWPYTEDLQNRINEHLG